MARNVQFIDITNSNIDSLLSDARWQTADTGTTQISYSFADSVDDYYVDSLFGYDESQPAWDFPYRSGFTAFDNDEKALVRSLLNDYENIIDVVFVETDEANSALIRFAYTNLDTEDVAGLASKPQLKYLPFAVNPKEVHQATELAGDIWIDTASSTGEPSLLAQTLIHEIGHALGLSHPHENGFEELTAAKEIRLSGELDYSRYTVMSYNLAPASVADRDLVFWSVASTPMQLDIEALQHLYGEGNNENDDVYVIKPSANAVVDLAAAGFRGYESREYSSSYISIVDNGGTNALYIPIDINLTIDLNPGTWSNTQGGILTNDFDDDNLYLAKNTLIHGLTTGAGADNITGNGLDNVIDSGAGNDVVAAGLGNDVVNLGDGWDRYDYVKGNDTINGGLGSDAIYLRGFSHSQFKFVTGDNGSLTLSAINTDAVIKLNSIESLVFAENSFGVINIQQEISTVNQSLLLQPDGPLYQSEIASDNGAISVEKAQLYRVYFASLGRAPDQEGYDFWLAKLNDGIYNFSEVSARFVDSDEFTVLADQDSNGSVENIEFLDHMYQNVFGRSPDQEGYNWWLDQLDSDIRSQSSVFENMVQSDEFVLISAGAVSDLWFV